MELDAVDDLLDQVDTDRPFLTCLFQAVEYFKTVESFSPPIFLHHQRKGILCSLARRKSFMAPEAFSPSSNGILILSQTGIDHFTFGMITERAFHNFKSLVPRRKT
jgi:hypothetical protein